MRPRPGLEAKCEGGPRGWRTALPARLQPGDERPCECCASSPHHERRIAWGRDTAPGGGQGRLLGWHRPGGASTTGS
eukprot:2245636-Alexandrium_andersonii.AAC.1